METPDRPYWAGFNHDKWRILRDQLDNSTWWIINPAMKVAYHFPTGAEAFAAWQREAERDRAMKANIRINQMTNQTKETKP